MKHLSTLGIILMFCFLGLFQGLYAQNLTVSPSDTMIAIHTKSNQQQFLKDYFFCS